MRPRGRRIATSDAAGISWTTRRRRSVTSFSSPHSCWSTVPTMTLCLWRASCNVVSRAFKKSHVMHPHRNRRNWACARNPTSTSLDSAANCIYPPPTPHPRSPGGAASTRSMRERRLTRKCVTWAVYRSVSTTRSCYLIRTTERWRSSAATGFWRGSFVWVHNWRARWRSPSYAIERSPCWTSGQASRCSLTPGNTSGRRGAQRGRHWAWPPTNPVRCSSPIDKPRAFSSST